MAGEIPWIAHRQLVGDRLAEVGDDSCTPGLAVGVALANALTELVVAPAQGAAKVVAIRRHDLGTEDTIEAQPFALQVGLVVRQLALHDAHDIGGNASVEFLRAVEDGDELFVEEALHRVEELGRRRSILQALLLRAPTQFLAVADRLATDDGAD